tara:strand:- start:2124 stop:4496 length:2373 start_codon:yes stop_codon:yes gene_type:complete
MHRLLALILAALLVPSFVVTANDEPFSLFIDEEVIIHPGETKQIRIAWQNIVNTERHISVEVNQIHSNLTIDGLSTDWIRVASGRLGETTINLTALPNVNYETITFSLRFSCQEDQGWTQTHEVDVLISRWSDLTFGSNDGSEFYVLQDVRTSFAVNLSNNAMYDDTVKLRFNTQSVWEFGFDNDSNNDDELFVDLSASSYQFVNFYIITPPIVDGAPLAGTGPMFTLEAISGLDRGICTWNFSLVMQTYHNITVDYVADNLSVEPGENDRLEVKIRNNGNVETYLDASISHGGINDDRIDVNNWTVALFNAFEFEPLQPNESRTLEVGFDAPNTNQGQLEVDLILMPQSFPQRMKSLSISSEIGWIRDGEISLISSNCQSVNWNVTCQEFLRIQNSGNFREEFILEVVNQDGMYYETTPDKIILSKNEFIDNIPLNLTTFTDAPGFLESSATINLRLSSGELIDSIQINSQTAPKINWVWEDSTSSVNNGRLEVAITMRNDGNTADGLVVRMTSSYFTDMSFIPPNNAIVEEGSTKIRSFEIVNIDKGANFTFRAWAEVPNDQKSDDDFFLNITAHSRLDGENPFRFSANTSFEGSRQSNDSEAGFIRSLTDFGSTIFAILWAWKWIMAATAISGLMISKAIRDRRDRIDTMNLQKIDSYDLDQPEDWMAEFSKKKQDLPQIARSPEMPADVFTGMFNARAGERKISAEPVDSGLLGAASTVLDHHDIMATKTKLDTLVSDIAEGDVSTPHVANTSLPDDAIPITQRTVPVPKKETSVKSDIDVEDLDL